MSSAIRKGVLTSLYAFIKNSPLGRGNEANATVPFVPPLAAFGKGLDVFKRLASGLAYKHPDFPSVRLAHGGGEEEARRGGVDVPVDDFVKTADLFRLGQIRPF